MPPLERLPELFNYAVTDQTIVRFFPFLIIVIIGLIIWNSIIFIRVSRIKYSGDEDFLKESKRIDYLLRRHLIWFLLVALVSFARIGLMVFWDGIFKTLENVMLMHGPRGEFHLGDHIIYLMNGASYGIFKTFEIFSSLGAYLIFTFWKNRIVYRVLVSQGTKKEIEEES